MRKCEVEGCDRKHKARGFCLKHYKTVWRRSQGLCRECPNPTRNLRCVECKRREKARWRGSVKEGAFKMNVTAKVCR